MSIFWRPLRRIAWSPGLALLAAACASGPRPSAGPAVPQACELRSGSARGGVLEVHAPGGIDPEHAPVPVTPAERIAFRHLYETLLVVDCTGARRPGLAEMWEPEDGGRAWRFTLREGASFWDGTPVRAEDVLASWRASASVQGGAFSRALPSVADHRLRAAMAGSTEVVDASTLRVSLDRPLSEPPKWLADPALAVHSPRSDRTWPSGTGAWQIHPEASLPGGDPTDGTAGRWVAWPGDWTPGDARPVLRFHAGRSADPRELLDAGEDLVVTDDPAVLAYAATLPALEALPLPWDRTYALLVEGLPAEINGGSAERSLREALARDAVRAEARASEVPASAGAESACESVAAPAALRVEERAPAPPSSETAARIVYPREDRTARELAERLVALAAGRPGPAVPTWVTRLPRIAGGLSDDAFAAALRQRSEAAFVLAVPRESTLPCALRLDPGPGRVLRPLVDARRRVIVADDVTGLGVDGDGTLLLFGAGRTEGTP